MTCDAKIRPFPGNTEIGCDRDADHDLTSPHSGILADYAYEGSRTSITWKEDDRRNFRGEWTPCPSPGCILPATHGGRHAV
jgi:hypothetical protein